MQYKNAVSIVALFLLTLLSGCASVVKSQGPIEQMSIGESQCISSVKQPFTCHFTIRVDSNAPSGQQLTYKIVAAKKGASHIEIRPDASGVLYAGESITISVIVHQCPFTIKVVDTGQHPPLSFFTLSQTGCPSY